MENNQTLDFKLLLRKTHKYLCEYRIISIFRTDFDDSYIFASSSMWL